MQIVSVFYQVKTCFSLLHAVGFLQLGAFLEYKQRKTLLSILTTSVAPFAIKATDYGPGFAAIAYSFHFLT